MGGMRKLITKKEFHIEVYEWKTGNVVKRLGPVGPFEAEKVERGLLINMNRDDYGTRIVPVKKKIKGAK